MMLNVQGLILTTCKGPEEGFLVYGWYVQNILCAFTAVLSGL